MSENAKENLSSTMKAARRTNSGLFNPIPVETGRFKSLDTGMMSKQRRYANRATAFDLAGQSYGESLEALTIARTLVPTKCIRRHSFPAGTRVYKEKTDTKALLCPICGGNLRRK